MQFQINKGQSITVGRRSLADSSVTPDQSLCVGEGDQFARNLPRHAAIFDRSDDGEFVTVKPVPKTGFSVFMDGSLLEPDVAHAVPGDAVVVFARTDQQDKLPSWYALKRTGSAAPPPRERGQRGVRAPDAKKRQEQARKKRKRDDAAEAAAQGSTVPVGSEPAARAAQAMVRLSQLLAEGKITAKGFAHEAKQVTLRLQQQLRASGKKKRTKQNQSKRARRQTDQRQRGSGAARACPAKLCRFGRGCQSQGCRFRHPATGGALKAKRLPRHYSGGRR